MQNAAGVSASSINNALKHLHKRILVVGADGYRGGNTVVVLFSDAISSSDTAAVIQRRLARVMLTGATSIATVALAQTPEATRESQMAAMATSDELSHVARSDANLGLILVTMPSFVQLFAHYVLRRSPPRCQLARQAQQHRLPHRHLFRNRSSTVDGDTQTDSFLRE